jgi:hypothetical protein
MVDNLARSGIDGFAADLAQLQVYMSARVPVYERLLGLVTTLLEDDVGRRLRKAWSRRSFTVYYDRPLLLLATLRFDALREGPSHPLWQAIAAPTPDPNSATTAGLIASLGRDRQRARVWHSLAHRTVQTNEVSRAVTWLWPAALLGDRTGMALCDVGASAGLNLVADAPALALSWTAHGTQLAIEERPDVGLRIGFDRAPLDVSRDEDADWLRACIWPGEFDRLERLERAIAAFRAARQSASPPVIEQADAREVPARLLALSSAKVHPFWLAYQTVVREYLGSSRQDYLVGMRQWLATMPRGSALWIELEAPPDGATRERPAAIIGHARDGGGQVIDAVLARCEYHPLDIAPEPDEIARLGSALGR